MFALIIFNTK